MILERDDKNKPPAQMIQTATPGQGDTARVEPLETETIIENSTNRITLVCALSSPLDERGREKHNKKSKRKEKQEHRQSRSSSRSSTRSSAERRRVRDRQRSAEHRSKSSSRERRRERDE
ncbi:uncharacterized [Tachysurus ichikawai]